MPIYANTGCMAVLAYMAGLAVIAPAPCDALTFPENSHPPNLMHVLSFGPWESSALVAAPWDPHTCLMPATGGI